jgi:Leucine-rich repeat (LRR) protein
MKTLAVLENGNLRIEFSREELEEILSNFEDYQSYNLTLKNELCRNLRAALGLPDMSETAGAGKEYAGRIFFPEAQESIDITDRFADPRFMDAVRGIIGGKSGEAIFESDVRNIRAVNVSGREISSLAGIEYFAALKSLFCSGNTLLALDVSKNRELTVLECLRNGLTELNVAGNPALTVLKCSGNPLKALDVSNNRELRALECDDCRLTALDVSKNRELKVLKCRRNGLTALNVSNNSALHTLICDSGLSVVRAGSVREPGAETVADCSAAIRLDHTLNINNGGLL